MFIQPVSGSAFVYTQIERTTVNHNRLITQAEGELIRVTARPEGMDFNDATLKEGSASLPQYGDMNSLSIQTLLAQMGPIQALLGNQNEVSRAIDGYILNVMVDEVIPTFTATA